MANKIRYITPDGNVAYADAPLIKPIDVAGEKGFGVYHSPIVVTPTGVYGSQGIKPRFFSEEVADQRDAAEIRKKQADEKVKQMFSGKEYAKLGGLTLAGAAAAGLGAASLGYLGTLPGTVAGNFIGDAAGSMALGMGLEEGQRAAFGRSAGDIVYSQLKPYIGDFGANMARPEYIISPSMVLKNTYTQATNNLGRQFADQTAKLASKPSKYAFDVQNFKNTTADFLDKTKQDLNSLSRSITFPFKNTYRRYVTRPKRPFDFNELFSAKDADRNLTDYLWSLQRDYKKGTIQLEDQFGNQLLYNRKGNPTKARFVIDNREPQQITPEIRSQVFDYKQNFENLIGDDGVVAGSTRGIANGYINGTLNNDTEVITTKLRAEALKKKLNFQFYKSNSVGGHTGTSPFAKGKTNYVEFDFIDESPEGYAKGTLAHSIYSVLYPEKRASIINKILTKDKFNPVKTDDIELPISAEELYSQFQKAPEEVKDLVGLVDMLGSGINTVTEANAMKHGERAWNVLLNQEHTSQVSKAIDILGKKWFGSSYKIPSKEYPNLKFDDVVANKEFINNIINITDKKVPNSYIDKIASNPKQMENLFNYWYQNNLITHRYVENPGKEFTPQQTWDALFNTTHSVGGGTGSGVGRNNTSGKMLAFDGPLRGTTQALITFHPEKIENLSQFTKKFQEISDPDIVNDFSIYKENPANSVWTPEQTKEVLEYVHSLDRPIVRSTTTTRGVGAYNGSYVGSNYPQDFDPILGKRPSVVSYQQSPEFGFAFSPQFSTREYMEMLPPYVNYADRFRRRADPKLNDRFREVFKTTRFADETTHEPKQITNLKNLGFVVKGGPSQREILKQTQQYINGLLPGGRMSVKDVKSVLNSDNIMYSQEDLIKKLSKGRGALYEQQRKYNRLRHRQNNFINNVKSASVGVGGITPLMGITLYSIHQIKQDERIARDLANKIYGQLSQEQQKKVSKEDLAYELYGFENEQKALEYLKESGYKFKK